MGRFAESRQLIDTLLAKPEMPPTRSLSLRAIEIAGLLAVGQKKPVGEKLEALINEISQQPTGFYIDWVFDGTKHFINQNAKLMPYRNWLTRLFDALKLQDTESMVRALRAVKAEFLTRKGK